jgi:hypothetical protein
MHSNITLQLLISMFALTALSHVILYNDTSAAPLDPRGGTNVLNVAYRCGRENSGNQVFEAWAFYTTTQGTNAACNKGQGIQEYHIGRTKRGCNKEPPTWPGGDWAIKPYGGECRYMDNGENPGALWCKDAGGNLVKTANCNREAKADQKKERWVHCGGGWWEMPIVYCEWPQ